MTQTATNTLNSLTLKVFNQFFNVPTGRKTPEGYLEKITIGSELAAKSLLGGHELKSNLATIDIVQLNEKIQSGEIPLYKGRYLQFTVNSNPKKDQQLAELQAKIQQLQAQIANPSKFSAKAASEDIPF